MKNKKILLASGDSLTEHTLASWENSSIPTDFPRWPEVLADKLDLECVNLCRAGWSNQLISTSIFEYLMENPKKEIGLVCCLWTEYTRTSIYNMPEWPANVAFPLFSGFLSEVNELANQDPTASLWKTGPDKFLDLLYYHAKYSNTKAKIIVENMIKNNIKIFHDLGCMLQLRNIPFLYLQGAFPFFEQIDIKKDRGLEKIYAPSIEQLLFYFLKYENWFDKTKFVGWPGPFNCDWPWSYQISPFLWSTEPTQYFISNEDRHPNEKGHQMVKECFYKNIEELYPHLL